MEKLTNDYPDNEDFQINLATAYREIGDFKKSKKIVNTGFKNLFSKRINNEPVKESDSIFWTICK